MMPFSVCFLLEINMFKLHILSNQFVIYGRSPIVVKSMSSAVCNRSNYHPLNCLY